MMDNAVSAGSISNQVEALIKQATSIKNLVSTPVDRFERRLSKLVGTHVSGLGGLVVSIEFAMILYMHES